MSDLIYIIVPKSDIDKIDFNKTIEQEGFLRYNNDGSEFIVKYKTAPSGLSFKTYSHSEVLEFINNPDNGWVKEE